MMSLLCFNLVEITAHKTLFYRSLRIGKAKNHIVLRRLHVREDYITFVRTYMRCVQSDQTDIKMKKKEIGTWSNFDLQHENTLFLIKI